LGLQEEVVMAVVAVVAVMAEVVETALVQDTSL